MRPVRLRLPTGIAGAVAQLRGSRVILLDEAMSVDQAKTATVMALTRAKNEPFAVVTHEDLDRMARELAEIDW